LDTDTAKHATISPFCFSAVFTRQSVLDRLRWR